MTSLPDWLVERAALDEVPPASRARLDGADAELAIRIAQLRADDAAELAAHPAAPAVAQIQARVVAERRRVQRRRGRLLGLAGAVAAAVLVIVAWPRGQGATHDEEEVTRVKGAARLLAFRLVDDHVEKLDHDALVHAGDVIQLRYNAGGAPHGVIASVDGAGVVTLHYPATETASTALAARSTALPNAYALDDAPAFERFFFLTADQPVDVRQVLASLRTLAQRADGASASPELPAGIRAWSLRLRKPERREDRHE